MSAWLVVLIDEIHDPARYDQYKDAVPELVRRHGGVYRARSVDPTVVEGRSIARSLIVEFPHRAALDALFADPMYAAIAPLRRQSTSGVILALDGERPSRPEARGSLASESREQLPPAVRGLGHAASEGEMRMSPRPRTVGMIT